MKIPIAIPNGRKGDWAIESYHITKQEARFANMRAAFGHSLESVVPGWYKKLTHRGSLIMSNTPMEIRTHAPVLHARGRVLISGLGLGMVIVGLLRRDEVRAITVTEIEKDVIDLVKPHLRDRRLTIIQADAYEWLPPNGDRFDYAWHDIWPSICEDNLPKMRRIKKHYAKCCDCQGCWSEFELKHHIR